jgi:hypothetical protein
MFLKCLWPTKFQLQGAVAKRAGHIHLLMEKLSAPMLWVVLAACRFCCLSHSTAAGSTCVALSLLRAEAHQMLPTPSVPILLAAPPDPLGQDAASRQRPPLVEQGEKPLLHTQIPAWQICAITLGSKEQHFAEEGASRLQLPFFEQG